MGNKPRNRRSPASQKRVDQLRQHIRGDREQPPEDATVGERIAALRQERGPVGERSRDGAPSHPQSLIAELVDVTERAYQGWESDKSRPSRPRLYALAETFHTMPAWIEHGEGPIDPPELPEGMQDGHATEALGVIAQRLQRLEQRIVFVADNQKAITRLEESVRQGRGELAELRDLVRDQGSALGDLLQELARQRFEIAADRRSGEAHAPPGQERRASAGRRRTDPPSP